MKEYKLIAFDMDGTLLTSKNTISEPVQKALNEAVCAGKTVIICTGRTYRELIDYDQREFQKIRYYARTERWYTIPINRRSFQEYVCQKSWCFTF